MTCKDCIHYEVCQYHITEETDMTIDECGKFKNKSDFVEVVRCKDCKHYHSYLTIGGFFRRECVFDEECVTLVHEMHFCSCGERRNI